MSQSLIVTIILIYMVVMFFWGKIPMAATALTIPLLLQITGILKFKDAWAGFSGILRYWGQAPGRKNKQILKYL